MPGLQITYRPQNFDEVAGNDAAVESIINILKREPDQIPQSWLFHGPAGCGKTTLARIMKEELGCDDTSFFEYNASNTRGIDTIREISSNANLAAISGTCKVYLVDECHQITPAAQESFLKTLEDVPPDTFFFLCTTNPEKLRPAIRSRCTSIKVEKLAPKAIRDYLKWILDCEEIPADEWAEILVAISKNCDGAMRDAVKLLDTVLDMGDFDQMLEVIQTGLAGDDPELTEICRVLLGKGNADSKWKQCAPIVQHYDKDVEGARRGILAYLSKALLGNGGGKTAEMMTCFIDPYFDTGHAGFVLSVYMACAV